MVVDILRNFGTPRMIEECADAEIVDAFNAYCTARDRRERAWRRKATEPAVMAAIVRTAAGLVFSEDSYERGLWFCGRVENPDWYTSTRLFAVYGGSTLADTLMDCRHSYFGWGITPKPTALTSALLSD